MTADDVECMDNGWLFSLQYNAGPHLAAERFDGATVAGEVLAAEAAPCAVHLTSAVEALDDPVGSALDLAGIVFQNLLPLFEEGVV